MGTDLNIGHATAYAYAKSKGYTGTEEQFATELAQFAQNAQKVAEDRAAVEQLVDEFLNTTAPAVIQDVTDEGTSQVERVAGAGTAQVTRVGQAGDAQIDAVASAGTTQIGLVTAEGTTQVTRVQDKGDEVIDSIPADYTALTEEVSDLNRQITQLGKKIDDNTFVIGDTVSIQRATNASQFTKNNPDGFIYVESTDKPIFTGTINFIDFFGLAQGTFIDNGSGGSGVIIEIDGNECYIHGSPTKGFRFDLQKGEFYTDSFANHTGNLSNLPDIGTAGYSLCFWEKQGYSMPSNIYFARLNQEGTAINPTALSGHSGSIWQNNTYLAVYSNGAISNLDVKFTFGLKIYGMPASIASIEQCAKSPYNTKAIQNSGFYECGELTWTGSDTVCLVKSAIEKYQNLEKNHVFAWFGDSLSQLKELPNIVEKLLVAKVYDCTFAGSPLTYGDPTLYQPTGFMSLCSQIVAGNFSDLSAALAAQQSAGINVTEKLAHLATLQALDFSTVTDIVVFAGTNDFDNDYVNATNFTSGFTTALTTLLTAYPQIMVYVISPTWRGDKSQGVQTIPTMDDLVELEADVAKDFNLPFYDLYHRSGINSITASVYLENDLLHPSTAGDKLLANKCAKFILSN